MKRDWISKLFRNSGDLFSWSKTCISIFAVTGKYKGDVTIDQQTIKQWKQDLANYEQPSGIFENDEDYLKQVIEIDAIPFDHKHMNELYGVQTIIPDINKHRIKSKEHCWFKRVWIVL